MRFGYPAMLWLMLVAMPVLCLFLWWGWRKRQALTKQFIQTRLLAQLTSEVSRSTQKLRLVLLAAAVWLLLIVMSRPQWGFTQEEARQQGLDILVAIDTSRSMLAEDISPNRLARAKLAAMDLMHAAKTDRLGLIAFAGTAFLQCPLTLDEEAFRQSIDALDTGIIPQGGTALTEAIETASRAFKEGEDNHKILVLMTDGEDHENGAVQAAEKAARAGIRIFTIGVGTANGELLRQRDESGNLSYIKDDSGNVVKSRLNETLLKNIATEANGFYLPLSGTSTMDMLYKRGLAPLPKGKISSKMIQQYKERFQWFLGLAIALIVAELFLPNRKRSQNQPPAVPNSTNAELRQAVTALMLILGTVAATASPGSAIKNYNSGNYEQAEQDYKKLLERKPNDPKLHYNAGAAAYQSKSFDEAAKQFSASLSSPDLHLQEQSFYNLGNTFYRLGENETEPNKKIESWENAVKQYDASLKLNPSDPDAKFNMDLVKKQLEELKKQQQQQQKQNQDKKNQDKKDNKDDKNQQKQDDQNKDKDKDKDQKPDDSKSDKDKKDQKDQNKDSSKEDQKDKSGEQNTDQSQQNQEQKQQQQQPQPDQKDGSSQQPEKDKEGENIDPSEMQATPGQMSQQQAKRLLDAQKGEEKAMIFTPRDKKKRARVFKDW